MTKQEVDTMLEKIRAYRQSFLITDFVVREWRRILEPYDYEDVDNKLNEYFEDIDNKGRYPDPIYLVKYLTKKDDKLKPGIIYIPCQICYKKIEMYKFDEHFDRCSSIDYICRNSEKYYNKKINKEKLRNLSNIEFGIKYWKFCENLSDVLSLSKNERFSLENAIITHYGHEPSHNLEEILKVSNSNDRTD